MACIRFDFYLPKESAQAQLLEGKQNLLRLRQEITLNEAELAAVEQDVAAYDKLLQDLASIPTPGGSNHS
jgi:hypothetical protein